MIETIEVRPPALVQREAEYLESILDKHAPWIGTNGTFCLVGEAREELMSELARFGGIVGTRLYMKGWLDGRGTRTSKADSASSKVDDATGEGME